MKKIILFLIAMLAMAGSAHAEDQTNYWKLSGTTLSPVKSTWSLSVAGGITFGASTMSGNLAMGDYDILNVGTMYVDADSNSGIGSNVDNDVSIYNNGTRYLGFNGNTMSFLGGTPTITTSSNTILTVAPNGTAYTKFGDAGTCLSVGGTDNDDVCVTDDLEVMDTIQTGGQTFATNRGDVPVWDFSVTNASAAGTAQAYPFLIDGQFIGSFHAESDGAGGVQNKEFRSVNIRNYGDLISARMTLPNDTTLPATCAVGNVFLDTDDDDCSDSGGGDGAFCLCKATDTWALVADI